MKAIIVYYSYSRNNEMLAKELRLRFSWDILKIEEQKSRNGFTILLDLLFKRKSKIQKTDVSLSDYDVVIFVSPIWDAKIATPLKSFIQLEKDHIKNYAFITVCGGREGQHRMITDQLIQLIDKEPMIVTELPVNDLLPDEQRNKIKYVTPYRTKTQDFQVFKNYIQDFADIVFEYAAVRNEERHLMRV
ncbi:MAG: hypothetical protein HYR67_02480 [Bacteroidetes bacterium]|nr:hypothetical protein [Bacteroidota bacterium]